METEEKKEVKIFDLDGAFDKRVAEYLAKKKGRYTEEQCEDLVAALYKQFGDTRIESIGATPNEYYSRMSSEELAAVLRAHFERGVSVNGFLRAAAEEEKNRPVLRALLNGTDKEAMFALNILGAERASYQSYLSLLARENAEELCGEIAGLLQEDADFVCEELLELYRRGVARDWVADILSYCLIPRDEIFSILLERFLNGEESADVAAARLGRYGDERALPYIKERAEREDTAYLDWRAMRLAAEALGGGVAERDFSSDEEYLALQREETRLREEREKESEKERNGG